MVIDKFRNKTKMSVIISLITLVPISMTIFSVLVWWNTKDVRAQVQKIEAFQKRNIEELRKKADNSEIQLKFDNIKETLEAFQSAYQIEIESLRESNKYLAQNVRDLNQNLTNILLHLNKQSN